MPEDKSDDYRYVYRFLILIGLGIALVITALLVMLDLGFSKINTTPKNPYSTYECVYGTVKQYDGSCKPQE